MAKPIYRIKWFKRQNGKLVGAYQDSTKYHPGRWTKTIAPVICESGYHTCFLKSLARYRNSSNELWLVECRGDVAQSEGKDKEAWESIKLIRRLKFPSLSRLKNNIKISYHVEAYTSSTFIQDFAYTNELAAKTTMALYWNIPASCL